MHGGKKLIQIRSRYQVKDVPTLKSNAFTAFKLVVLQSSLVLEFCSIQN